LLHGVLVMRGPRGTRRIGVGASSTRLNPGASRAEAPPFVTESPGGRKRERPRRPRWRPGAPPRSARDGARVHPHHLPVVTVEVVEGAVAHEAVILRRHRLLGAEGDRLVAEGVHLLRGFA